MAAHLPILIVLQAGSAVFGPNLDVTRSMFGSSAVLASPAHGCIPITNNVKDRIAIMTRGNCMFIEKVYACTDLWCTDITLRSGADGAEGRGHGGNHYRSQPIGL